MTAPAPVLLTVTDKFSWSPNFFLMLGSFCYSKIVFVALQVHGFLQTDFTKVAG